MENSSRDADTDELLKRAARQDNSARAALLQRHRGQLRKMIAVRLDPQVSARVDPSDVVQETLAAAAARLDRFLVERPVAYYAWLRQLAWEKLVELHRRHVRASKRTVRRERDVRPGISDASISLLADQLPVNQSSPSQRVLRAEVHSRVKQGLSQLDPEDREIVVMRHLEGMSVKEIAMVLQMPEGTVKRRHFQAVRTLRDLLSQD